MSSISAIAGSMMVGTKKTCVVPYACTASAKYRSPVMRGMVISYLKEDGPRGEVELRPAEQPRGHEQRRVAEAEAGTDQRLEQGSAGAGDAQRHASPATHACRRSGRDRLDESRFVAPRRRPDPLAPPIGEGGELAAALDRHRYSAVAPPVGQVVGAAVAYDLRGQLLSAAGIAWLLPLPRVEPGSRLESRHRRGIAIQAVDRPARRHPGHHVAGLGARVERGPGAANLRPARLAVGQCPLEQRPPHTSPLVAGAHEEHGQVPHPAADQGRDHATDPPLLDGAEVAVRIAGQPRPGIARYRGIARPRRRPTSAHHEVVARGDVHPPHLLELIWPDVADVRLAHGRIIQLRRLLARRRRRPPPDWSGSKAWRGPWARPGRRMQVLAALGTSGMWTGGFVGPAGGGKHLDMAAPGCFASLEAARPRD